MLHAVSLMILTDDSILVVGLIKRRTLALTALVLRFIERLAEL